MQQHNYHQEQESAGNQSPVWPNQYYQGHSSPQSQRQTIPYSQNRSYQTSPTQVQYSHHHRSSQSSQGQQISTSQRRQHHSAQRQPDPSPCSPDTDRHNIHNHRQHRTQHSHSPPRYMDSTELVTLAHRPRAPKPASRSSTNGIRKAMSVERFLNPVPEPKCSSPTGSSSGSGREGKRNASRKQSPTSSPTSPKKSTGARPPYTIEEGLYIWYLRTDLGQAWDTVEDHFGQWYGKHKRDKGGLQCKFYRIIASWEVECVRKQHRGMSGDDNDKNHENWTAAYGVVDRTDVVLPWMRPEHQRRPVNTGPGARLKAPLPENPRPRDRLREQSQSRL